MRAGTHKQAIALLAVLIIGMVILSMRSKIASAVADVAGQYWPLPPEGQQFAPLIQAAADNTGIPFDLIARQIKQESGFDPTIIGGDGIGRGLMQLTPKYYPGVNYDDPASNIDAGTGTMSDLYNKYNNWGQTLAAYNAGPGNVDRAIAAATAAGDASQWLLHLPTAPRNQVITQRYVGQILNDVPLEPLPAGARLA